MLPIKKPLRGILWRFKDNGKETLGNFSIFNGKDCVFPCLSLELPWLNNAQHISCIPAGRYFCKPRETPGKGRHFILENVPGRSLILIHTGNYAAGKKVDTEGCILLGMDFADINKDGEIDVTGSRIAMDRLVELCFDVGFWLDIVSV
jgi:hypothetical protein